MITISEHEESIYDERVAVRRLAYRNVSPAMESYTVTMDKSMESVYGAGFPPWLSGTFYILIPSIFEINYLEKDTSWWPLGSRESTVTSMQSRSLPTLNEALKMILKLELSESGDLQVSSRLLAPKALEEWRRAKGNPQEIDPNKIHLTLVNEPKKSPLWHGKVLSRRKNSLKEIPSDAVVIQSSLCGDFPLGPYHGSDTFNRLICHEGGSSELLSIDPVSLLPSQHFSYSLLNDRFKGIPCENPVFDPRRRELINVLMEEGRIVSEAYVKYHVIVIPSTVRQLHEGNEVGYRLASFLGPPTKLESFAITEQFVIIIFHTQRYDPKDMPTSDENRHILSGVGVKQKMKDQPTSDTLIYVISRKYGQLVAVYKSEPCFVWKVVNAFEGDEGDTIYVDAVASASAPSIQTIEQLKSVNISVIEQQAIDGANSASTLRRYCLFKLEEEMARFEGAAGQLSSFPLALFHHLTNYSLYSVCINPQMVGIPYRFCYGLAVDRGSRGILGMLPNAVIKCDLAAPIKSLQWHHHAHYPSPLVVVPNSEGGGHRSEEDAILCMMTLDVVGQKSYLTFLDARDLREMGRFGLDKAYPLTDTPPIWASLPTFKSPLLRENPVVEARSTGVTTAVITTD